ncbi:unnamed protein product [Cyclocybe aegerita]|uniref:carbonic anhydrase n=1 Tax=Cyclocybe aegerita TaxID=1973307 RepID=A0A8S0WQP5_CYCAE|nr:unnamed protein product [Cyclocybe aegerita]
MYHLKLHSTRRQSACCGHPWDTPSHGALKFGFSFAFNFFHHRAIPLGTLSFSSASAFRPAMPLSALVHTSRFTTAAVIRSPCTAGGTNACTHGYALTGRRAPAFSAEANRHPNGRYPNTASTSAHLRTRLHHIQPTTMTTLLAGFAHTQGATMPLGPNPPYRNHSGRRNHSTLAELFKGNQQFMAEMSKENPGLLSSLAKDGQRPPFMLVDCSDSRVNEQGIFCAQPGTMFTAGNIANRFDEDDINSNAVLSFAVASLKIKHVVVLGHYGCGGVAASMMPSSTKTPADVAVQTWIEPIRQTYLTSTRPAIVAHRAKSLTGPVMTPDLHDPAFRALVEENVKSNVEKIAKSIVVRNHYASLVGKPIPPASENSPTNEAGDLFIHGWVYDVENGRVSDLGVSVGPPGRPLPPSPFPHIASD